jgi:Mn2+/Fe2+ NRAMP family transporter
MDWFKRKTTIAGYQISNWLIVLGAIIIVLLIFQILGAIIMVLLIFQNSHWAGPERLPHTTKRAIPRRTTAAMVALGRGGLVIHPLPLIVSVLVTETKSNPEKPKGPSNLRTRWLSIEFQ